MSRAPASTDRPPLDRKARATIPLLIEYTRKLRAMGRRLQAIRREIPLSSKADRALAEARFKAELELYYRIKAAATELARYVSQMIEHSNLDDLTRIELGLRLGEFEQALLSYQDFVKAYGGSRE